MKTQGNNRESFLEAMSHTAQTVNVITTDGVGGQAGVTVSAMSSVSADGPNPLLLVCIHHMSKASSVIVKNGAFCVNVLREDQAFISDAFAGRNRKTSADPFSCTQWAWFATGMPRIIDPLVAFDCRLKQAEQHGTHYVMIGEVVDTFIGSSTTPLVYANRSYGTVSESRRNSQRG